MRGWGNSPKDSVGLTWLVSLCLSKPSSSLNGVETGEMDAEPWVVVVYVQRNLKDS